MNQRSLRGIQEGMSRRDAWMALDGPRFQAGGVEVQLLVCLFDRKTVWCYQKTKQPFGSDNLKLAVFGSHIIYFRVI